MEKLVKKTSKGFKYQEQKSKIYERADVLALAIKSKQFLFCSRSMFKFCVLQIPRWLLQWINSTNKTILTLAQITSTSGKTLNICQSRTNPLPGNNTQSSSTPGDSCKQITSDTYEIPLNYPCGDTQLIYCAPFYFSIAVVPSTSSSLSYCTGTVLVTRKFVIYCKLLNIMFGC